MNNKFYTIKNLLPLKSLCLFIFLLNFSLNFAQQTDSLKALPLAQLVRILKIDVKHIALDLTFDWQKKQAIGTATLTLSPLNPTNQILLDAAMLTINSITSAKGTPLKFDYDGTDKNDNLLIYLDKTYKSDENIVVKIAYHTNWVNEPDPNSLGGSNGKGLRFFQPTTTEPRKRQQIWSMSELDANRYWFPCLDVPNDLRTSELRATVDKKLTVISNGNLIKTTENANKTHTFHWKMDQPYANYQTSIVVGEYAEIKQNTEGVALHTYAYPDEIDAAKASVVRLPDMVQFFSKATGVKYPHSRYSQVFVQDLPWGMASINASTLSENMVDDYGTHADYFYLWDALEAESLAHQWFGNYLTVNDLSHIWLSRAFSRYFDGLYDAHKNGREEYLLYDHIYDFGMYLNDWNSDIRHPIVTKNIADKAAFATDNYSYFRGALVLHTLRKQLGEENWWKAIKHYVKTNAHASVTTEDFRKAIEATTGEPMHWFFDQWIYKMGHPIFEITKRYDGSKKQRRWPCD